MHTWIRWSESSTYTGTFNKVCYTKNSSWEIWSLGPTTYKKTEVVREFIRKFGLFIFTLEGIWAMDFKTYRALIKPLSCTATTTTTTSTSNENNSVVNWTWSKRLFKSFSYCLTYIFQIWNSEFILWSIFNPWGWQLETKNADRWIVYKTLNTCSTRFTILQKYLKWKDKWITPDAMRGYEDRKLRHHCNIHNERSLPWSIDWIITFLSERDDFAMHDQQYNTYLIQKRDKYESKSGNIWKGMHTLWSDRWR